MMRSGPLQAMILGILALGGCGGSHSLAPDAATSAQRPEVAPAGILPIDANSGNGLMFLYEGEADLAGNVTLQPVRSRHAGAIGDNFIVDLTAILGEGAPCADCVQLTDLAIDGSRLELTFGLKHPFPMGPLPTPGSLSGRNDLHVFDVRGYLVPRSGGPAAISVPGVLLDTTGDGTRNATASVIAGHLMNPNGYGPEFQLFAEPFVGSIPGNVHPFRDYFWNPTAGNFSAANPNGFADVQRPTGQNVFAMGTALGDPGSEQTFRLQTIQGRVNFYFMVTCAYGASANFPLSLANPGQLGARSNPKFFLPAFHRPEAVRVTATINQALGANDPGSHADLNITVIDWQGSRSPKGSPLALGDAPNAIPTASDVAEVVVHVPGVLTAPLVRTAADTGDGSPGNPYVFIVDLANEAAAAQGVYPGLVAVRDQRFSHEPSTPVGVKRDLTPLQLREYTTFQGFVVQVGPATAGSFTADPARLNVDLTDSRFVARTGADVVLDLSVVQQGDSTTDGVYFPATGDAGLVRYALDYSSSETVAPALTPLYTPNIVPDPGNPPPGFDPVKRLPIRRFDLGWDACGFAAGIEDFLSMRFTESEDPPGTQMGDRDLSSSMIFYNYYRSTNPPSGVGPVLWFEDNTSSSTGQPFAFLPGVYNDNASTPANEFLLSLSEAPIPVDVFEVGNAGDGDSYYGGVWMNSQDAANGNRPFQVLRVRGIVPGSTRGLNATGQINQLNFGVAEFSAIHLRAADMVWLGNGTEEVWLAYATNHIVAIRWPGASGLPGTTPEGSPRANIALSAGIPVDLEVMPLEAGLPRTINGQTQTSPVLFVLTDSGTIEILNNVYAAAPTLMQSINLSAAGVQGIPQHLDVNWTDWEIHVSTLDGGTPRVTVFRLG